MLRTISIVLTLLAFTAQAEGLQYIPKWHMTGGEACYGFDDAKKLVELDLRIGACDERERLHLVELTQLRLALTETQEGLRLSQLEVEAWKKHNDELETDYRKKIVELRESEMKRYSNTPLYIGAGVIVLVAGVLIGGVIARR